MVTKVGERGQVGIRGSSVTDEWEKLIKTAASRNGQTFADFVVDTTRAAALAIVKREETVSATLPARIEDVAAALMSSWPRWAPSNRTGSTGSSGRAGAAGGDGRTGGTAVRC